MVNKKSWFGILVMVLIFGMMVVGCEEEKDDTTNSVESVEILGFGERIGSVNESSLSLYFKNLYNIHLCDSNGNVISYDGMNGVIQDFNITINGSTVMIKVALTGLSRRINMTLDGTYIVGNSYNIKIIYTANPNRRICDGYDVLKSFTHEQTIKYE